MHTYSSQKSIHVQSYTHIQYMCTCQSIMTWEAAFPHTCTSVHEYPDILPVRMGSLSVCVCVFVCVYVWLSYCASYQVHPSLFLSMLCAGARVFGCVFRSVCVCVCCCVSWYVCWSYCVSSQVPPTLFPSMFCACVRVCVCVCVCVCV